MMDSYLPILVKNQCQMGTYTVLKAKRTLNVVHRNYGSKLLSLTVREVCIVRLAILLHDVVSRVADPVKLFELLFPSLQRQNLLVPVVVEMPGDNCGHGRHDIAGVSRVLQTPRLV